VASGVSAENAADYLRAGARGFIIGTSIKEGGRIECPVDPVRARALVRHVRALAAGTESGASS
jgi:predicted TIM-barrel enzyme